MEFTYSIASKEYVLYIPTFFHIGSYFEIRGHNVRIQISIKGLIFDVAKVYNYQILLAACEASI